MYKGDIEEVCQLKLNLKNDDIIPDTNLLDSKINTIDIINKKV